MVLRSAALPGGGTVATRRRLFWASTIRRYILAARLSGSMASASRHSADGLLGSPSESSVTPRSTRAGTKRGLASRAAS